MINVMGNESLSDAEKIQKANDSTLLKNKWIKKTTDILNTILSQIESSIPKLEPIKATKENTGSIPDYDRKEILDNFIVNLKHKNKDSHDEGKKLLCKLLTLKCFCHVFECTSYKKFDYELNLAWCHSKF